MQKTDKIVLGIENNDEILNRIDPGYVILLAGNPGAGKTIVASKVIYENMVKSGIKAIYVSFSETKNEYYKNLKKLGLDIEEFEKKGLFTFLEEITFINKELISELLNKILNTVDQTGAKILVIDSISPLLQLSENIITIREILHNFFYRVSKIKGIVTILVQEVPYGSESIGFGIEEFLVDAVIFLKTTQIKGKIIRIAEIKKLRGSDFSLTYIPFVLKYGKGATALFPHGGIQKTNKNKKINVMIGNQTFLVTMGSQNLIIANPKIDIQALASLIIVGTVVGTQKLLEQIRRKTLIRLLSHDIGEFSNQLEQCLSSSGIQKSKVEELMKSYILDGIDPNKYSLTEYFYHVQEIEEEEKPAFVVNIGLDTLLNLLADNEVYPRLELDAIIRRMNEGITTLYLMNGIIRDYYKIPLNEVYNNIWYFHISKDNKLIIRPFRLRMKIFTNEIYQVDSKTLKCF